jgi:hypothetical protein
MNTNTWLDGAYHSAVLGGLMFVNSTIAKQFKIKPTNLGNLDLKDYTMLTVNILIAMMIQQMLVRQGILPASVTQPADVIPSTRVIPPPVGM